MGIARISVAAFAVLASLALARAVEQEQTEPPKAALVASSPSEGSQNTLEGF